MTRFLLLSGILHLPKVSVWGLHSDLSTCRSMVENEPRIKHFLRILVCPVKPFAETGSYL